MSFDSSATGSSAFSGQPRRYTIKRKPAPRYIESPPHTSPLMLDISLSDSAPTAASWLGQGNAQEYRDRALAHLEGYRMESADRSSVVASPVVSPTTLLLAQENYEITPPSPALLGRSSSRTSQTQYSPMNDGSPHRGRPLSGMWPARKPSTRSSTLESGSGRDSRDTTRRPSKSHRLPRKVFAVDVFRPLAPPKSVHVRSDPTYLPSPVTAEFQHEELRTTDILEDLNHSADLEHPHSALPGESMHNLARFESRTSTFASGTALTASISDGSTTVIKSEGAATDMPQMVHRPTQDTVRSTSTWRPPVFLARILRDWWQRGENGEVTIEEPYRNVHMRALETVNRPPPVNISLPFLDGHSSVGPVTPLDTITPVTPERAALWRVDTETGFAAMHVMKLEPSIDERQCQKDEGRGCFAVFDALKECFGPGGREH